MKIQLSVFNTKRTPSRRNVTYVRHGIVEKNVTYVRHGIAEKKYLGVKQPTLTYSYN